MDDYKVNSITVNGQELDGDALDNAIENGYQTTLVLGEDYSITATYSVKIFTLRNILIVLGALVVVGLFVAWYVYAVKAQKAEQDDTTEIKIASKEVKVGEEKISKSTKKTTAKKTKQKADKFSMAEFNKVLQEEKSERRVVKKAPAVKKTTAKKVPAKKVVKRDTTKK